MVWSENQTKSFPHREVSVYKFRESLLKIYTYSEQKSHFDDAPLAISFLSRFEFDLASDMRGFGVVYFEWKDTVCKEVKLL